MLLALLFGPRANMTRDFRPIAETIEDESGDQQELFVGAPVDRENGLGVLLLSSRPVSAHHPGNGGWPTHDDLVVVPGFVPLDLPALAKAARTEVDLFALLRRALDPDGMGDVDVTCTDMSRASTMAGPTYRHHRYT